MTALSVAVDAIEPLLAKHDLDHKFASKVASEVITALETSGFFVTKDSHLAMMRTLLARLVKQALDDETPPRDLAALSNRVQAMSKEVAILEERDEQERKGKSNGKSAANKADDVEGFSADQL